MLKSNSFSSASSCAVNCFIFMPSSFSFSLAHFIISVYRDTGNSSARVSFFSLEPAFKNSANSPCGSSTILENSFSRNFIMSSIFLSVSLLLVEVKSFQRPSFHSDNSTSSGVSVFFPGRKKGRRRSILYLALPIVKTNSASALSLSAANWLLKVRTIDALPPCGLE